MKPTITQLEELLAQRRELRPEAGYWQDFLGEFHQKQSAEVVKSRGIKGLFHLVTTWFAEIGRYKWGYVAAVGCALVFTAFMVTPARVVNDGMQGVPVSYQLPSALRSPPIQQLNQLDLSPLTQGMTGEQIF